MFRPGSGHLPPTMGKTNLFYLILISFCCRIVQSGLKLFVGLSKNLGDKLVTLSRGQDTKPGVRVGLGLLGNNMLWASRLAQLWLVDTEAIEVRIKKQYIEYSTSFPPPSQFFSPHPHYLLVDMPAPCMFLKLSPLPSHPSRRPRICLAHASCMPNTRAPPPSCPSPHVPSSHVPSPNVLSPCVPSPFVPSPHAPSPHVLSPNVPSPHVTSVNVPFPHVTSPCFPSP